MLNVENIARIEQLVNEITRLGGERERTRIIPGLEVIDATPTGLTNYIVVKDDRGEGTNILAVKAPGVLYQTGDLVSVIFVEGTEPVAFQQSSGSSGSPVAVSKLVSPDLTIDPVLSADNNGDLTVADGDLAFSTASIISATGQLTVNSSSAVVFNEPGSDVDFRVESDTIENAFFIDGNNGRVGVNTGSPKSSFDVTGEALSPSSRVSCFSDSVGDNAIFYGTKARGTEASPTALQNGDGTLLLRTDAYDGSTYRRTSQMNFNVDAAPSGSDIPGSIIFQVHKAGTSAGAVSRAITIKNSTRVGIVVVTPLGQLHVDQSDTSAAIPVLYLDQADVSEEFIFFRGSAAAATLTQSIVDEGDVSTATRQGWLKVYVQDDGNQITDQAYFIPIYTLA